MQGLNIVNNSLTRLYRSHSHSSVTATVAPVQRSDDALEASVSLPDTDNDCDKVMSVPHLDHEGSHLDDNQGIKETAQHVVCM